MVWNVLQMKEGESSQFNQKEEKVRKCLKKALTFIQVNDIINKLIRAAGPRG